MLWWFKRVETGLCLGQILRAIEKGRSSVRFDFQEHLLGGVRVLGRLTELEECAADVHDCDCRRQSIKPALR